jgi:hypothetical protein
MKQYRIISGAWKAGISAIDIDDAKKQADDSISYNQESMTICSGDGETLCIRRWNSCKEGIEDCENPVDYGSFGYYGDWEEQ